MSFYDIFGDAVYVRGSNGINSGMLVSRDDLTTWQWDTAGFVAFDQAQSAVMDTAQNVYARGYSTLYYQDRDSNVWHQRPATGASVGGLLFVDQTDRLYMGGGTGVAYSTNGGNTFTNVSISTSGNPVGYAEDGTGRVFLLKSPNHIMVTTDRGVSWADIPDAPSATVNSISCDSAGLYAATINGLFATYDQGVHWTVVTGRSTLKGIVKGNDGSWIVTNDAGIWRKMPSDTGWVKTFPTGSSYAAMSKLFKTGSGAIYAPVIDGQSYSRPLRSVVKSIDNGQTWSYDTAGIALLGSGNYGGNFYVDEGGNQHLGGPSLLIYAKPSAGVWQIDTAGIPQIASLMTFTLTGPFVSDGVGHVRVSYSRPDLPGDAIPLVFKRPIAGGTWTPDVAGGLPDSKLGAYSMAADANHNVVIAPSNGLGSHASAGMWRYNASSSQWT
jgi:hypothetical protein